MSAILTGLPEDKPTTEQEESWARSGDTEALILNNLREAYYYCRGCYQSRSMSEGEVLSAAYEALTKAAKNFTPDNARLLAYAKPYLRGALSAAAREKDVVKKVRDIEELTPEPDDDDDKDVEVLNKIRSSTHVPCALPDFEEMSIKEDWAEIVPMLRTLLTDKERLVLELNFRGGLNLQEIADLRGNSRAYWQLQKHNGLKKIRHCLLEKGRYFDRT